MTVEEIKELGAKKDEQSLEVLLRIYPLGLSIDLKREIVSSIGRHPNLNAVFLFLNKEAFEKNVPMEVIYQMYRTCLLRGKKDERFRLLGEHIRIEYDNEVIEKMYRYSHNSVNRIHKTTITKPVAYCGDAEEVLSTFPSQSVQLIFTSPPYYNARDYVEYRSYEDYLSKMKAVLRECWRILEMGRFIVINVSPIITRRAGRQFESIRYPLPFDFHKILTDCDFYFVDEIIWLKPEPSVPNRNGGFKRTPKPLMYKPNCITESLLVYRRNCDFLLDKNIREYEEEYVEGEIDTSNVWKIAPVFNPNHPAVFPEELARRVIKYYSFKGDAVLDPFAGIGTTGKVAIEMGRIPVQIDIKEEYVSEFNSF